MNKCECGCGRSIEGLPRGTRFTPACARQRQIDRKRAARAENRAWCAKQRTERVALNGRQNYVRTDADQPNRHQALCEVCGGMPWRRDGACRGCGEPPGEETIRRGSALSSSAGAAVNHGSMYGS
jgi:hypothetical protein